MVTVTKTKVSTLPEPETMDDATTPTSFASSSSSYVTQSDSLIVTSSCLNRVERLIQQRQQQQQQQNENEDYFLRVFVDAGGCSGFQYQFEIDHELDDDEDVVVVSAADNDDDQKLHPRVVVDETSLGFLEGATLDYVMEMIRSSFVVRDNPKSESACGCGSSFAVKNFSSNPARD